MMISVMVMTIVMICNQYDDDDHCGDGCHCDYGDHCNDDVDDQEYDHNSYHHFHRSHQECGGRDKTACLRRV